MKSYVISDGWQIDVPESFIYESDEEQGQFIFYPEDSDLTIRATPFTANKNGIPATKDIMKNAFIGSISKSAVIKDNEQKAALDNYLISFEYTYYERNQKVYSISLGIYNNNGMLLTINIFGTNKDEVEKIYSVIKEPYNI
ncbi:MAG: hypothetical protein IJ740_01560 [Ruminococcus sp.]|nr:hypothetical protein [Ruminococcus sp.]